MYVRRLGLRDFRSWQSVDIDLDPGATVFVGRNGFGKTNLVEALWYCATLGSHRVGTDAPLIRSGESRAVISTIVVSEGRELAIDLEVVAGRANKALLNRSPVRSTREILGVLRAVLFAPEDLALVRGIPVSDGGTSTNWPHCIGRGSQPFAPIMKKSSNSAPRCSKALRRPDFGATTVPWKPSRCGTATWRHTVRS